MLDVVEHDLVHELRLNFPPVNALRHELVHALRKAVEGAPDRGARALVISGSPGFFSAGLDVVYQIERDQDAANAIFHELFAMMRAIGTSTIPVAAAVTGHAAAGGALIAMFCDYRIMADGDYKIGLTEVQVGLPVPPVIFETLSRLVGPRLAERFCVEGRMVEAREAFRVGLVDEIAAPDEVIEASIAWCRRLLDLPPRAMRMTRAAARTEIGRIFAQFGWEELDELAAGWSGAETQNAIRALVEKMKNK